MKTYQKLLMFGFCLLLTISISGCGETKVDKNFSLSFKGMVGDEAYTVGEWYPNAMGQYFKLEKFRFYVSRIEAVNEAGTAIEVAEVDLYDLQNPTNINVNLPTGNYQAINFYIGLDEALNASDPTLFGADEPLGNSEHYWTWATKYIFAMIRGKVGEVANPDVNNTGTFVYDLGTEALLQSVSLPRSFTTSEDEVKEVEIIVHIDEVFNGETGAIDMLTDNVTHSFDKIELAETVIENLANAME